MACASQARGIGGFVRHKLGRCLRCMRLSLGMTVLGIVVWLVVTAAIGPDTWGPDTWLARLIGLVALAALLLWMAHLIAFARYAAQETRFLAQVRGRAAPSGVAATAVLRGAGLSLPAWLVVDVLHLAAATPSCNCYFDDECWLWSWCDYSAVCQKLPKGESRGGVECPTSERNRTGSCDGICTWFGAADVPTAELSAVIGAYLDAFVAAARTPETPGLPRPTELAELAGRLPEDCRRDVRRWVFGALDVVVGWDLVHGAMEAYEATALYTEAFLGHVADPVATPALLEATREALLGAIEARDPDRVAGPLARFWERHPGYAPNHAGRCYPHGGHRVYATALECQAVHLRSMVRALLRPHLEGRAATAA